MRQQLTLVVIALTVLIVSACAGTVPDNADSLPDVTVVGDADALPDVTAAGDADALPDVTATSDADATPDVTATSDADPPRLALAGVALDVHETPG